MKELSLHKRERIERVLIQRRAKLSRQRETSSTQKLDGLIVFMAFSFATLILGALFLVKAEWRPGHQDQIAREYHALRHDATTVAVEEWK